MDSTANRSAALRHCAIAFLAIASCCCVASVWCMFNGTWIGILGFAVGTVCASGAYLALGVFERIEARQEELERRLPEQPPSV